MGDVLPIKPPPVFDHFVGADFLEQRFNAHRFMGSDDQV